MAPSTCHLEAAGQPPEFAAFMDLEIKHGEIVYLCSSTSLAMESKVLCKMFQTGKHTWRRGVEASLAGHQQGNVELMLALTHGGNDVNKVRNALKLEMISDWEEVEDLLNLIHKLDMPRVQKVRGVTFIFIFVEVTK